MIKEKKAKMPSVLVIEDNEMFSKLALDMLNGHTTYSAATAAEGMNKFKSYKPDITFVDIGLPDDTGHNVLSKLKAINPTAFIVMLTASNLQNDVQNSLKNGARGYIVKPFSRQKIKECIDKYYLYSEKIDKINSNKN